MRGAHAQPVEKPIASLALRGARYRLFRSLLVRSHGGLIEDRT